MPVQLYVHRIYSRFQLFCFMTNLLPQPRCMEFFWICNDFFPDAAAQKDECEQKGGKLHFNFHQKPETSSQDEQTDRRTDGRMSEKQLSLPFTCVLCTQQQQQQQHNKRGRRQKRRNRATTTLKNKRGTTNAVLPLNFRFKTSA